ncbi:hypothetical protein D3C77_247640 [compost metagenome]
MQVGARRAVADDDLGARQVQLQEGFDVLLDGDPADVEEEGPRPVFSGIIGAAELFVDGLQVRAEQIGVHAARPGRDVPEAMLDQFVAQGGRRHHQPARRLVEPLHIGVADLHRDREAGRDVFREFGVIAGGEGQLPFHADAARGDAQGAFGGDVHGLGLEGAQTLANLLLGA